MPRTPSNRLWVRCCLVGICALALLAGLYVVAVTVPTQDSFLPKCLFHSLTGLHCPGCGTTRALHFALNGQLLTAAKYNAISLVVVPILVVSAFRSLIAWTLDRPRPIPNRRPRVFWAWLFAIALVAFGILRNIPVEPFTELAPKEISQPQP